MSITAAPDTVVLKIRSPIHIFRTGPKLSGDFLHALIHTFYSLVLSPQLQCMIVPVIILN
jgi:hypothetical protein